MIDLFKKLTLGIVILFSITNFASAETTISAEGQYIFNTLDDRKLTFPNI